MRFTSYIGIDYSGAGTPKTRSGSLQVYMASSQNSPQRVTTATAKPAKRNWNRSEIQQWLVEYLKVHAPAIVGIDHGFSFPLSYFEKYQLSGWDEFLEDFAIAWPTHLPEATVEQFRCDASRTGDATDLRLPERWTASAKSVFQFDVQGSVAKSTHAGLPLLLELRQKCPDLHFWPFDGFEVPEGCSVIAEVFPSLFRHRYSRSDRTVDQQDAYAVCRWTQEMDAQSRLEGFFDPPLTKQQRVQAKLEGWILGVL